MKLLTKHIAIFCLAVFLFPLAAKCVHDIQHHLDRAAPFQKGISAAVSKHYCGLCDYVPAPNDAMVSVYQYKIFTHESIQTTLLTYYYNRVEKCDYAYHYSLRGPPSSFSLV